MVLILFTTKPPCVTKKSALYLDIFWKNLIKGLIFELKIFYDEHKSKNSKFELKQKLNVYDTATSTMQAKCLWYKRINNNKQ